MSSLLEIICGVGSRLPACTRIVMRRACSCEVRWGNGLRCGARAVVRRCFARICWLRCSRVYKCILRFASTRSYIIFADEFSNAPRRRPGMLRELYNKRKAVVGTAVKI